MELRVMKVMSADKNESIAVKIARVTLSGW